ncbi:MAG: hypothetical protein C0508_00910 [Cyanobacteria bacterium PR.023]|nr:hypothetical protein [Cyanobacteria bacterium PR.3.49]MBA4073566.1 hypothetical protein [Cyanobacteria bacterium PR.023]
MTTTEIQEIFNLKDVRESDEGIFKIHQAQLGAQTVALLNSLSSAYRAFLKDLDGANFYGSERDNDAVIACIFGCHYDKDMGMLAVLRGHKTDAAFYTRRAMEYASFGAHILKALTNAKSNEEKTNRISELYLNGINSKTAFEKYRSEFPIMVLLRDSSIVFGKWFYDQYEELSREAHASYESIMLKLEKIGLGYNLAYHEIKEVPRIYKGIERLLQLVEVHLCILRGFLHLLKDAKRFDGAKTLQSIESTDYLLGLEKQRWAAVKEANGIRSR